MVTRVELERANAQLHAHFLALSGQIFGELSQLERLIASRPPAARVSGLATAAEIASAQRQLRAQIDRLPSSSLQRYESLRRALDAQQGVLRQLSFIVEQHTPAQRRANAPSASAARLPWQTPETRRQQSVPRNPIPAAQEQIPRVYTSPAPPAQQYSAPAEEYPDQPTASRVRDRDAIPAWSRHLRRLRVGTHSGAKTASANHLLAFARKRIYPAATGVGARSLGLLAMVVAGAVVSYGMFPYASEQPNAGVKPIEIGTRKIGATPLPAGAPPPLPPTERGAVVDLASPPMPPLAAAPSRIAQEAPAPPPRPSPAPFSVAAERTPSLSPSGLGTRAERPVPARVAALQPEIAGAPKSAPPAASAAVRQPAAKVDPAIAAPPKADPVVAAAPVPAAVAPDVSVDVLKRFGMLGRIAVDCAEPHSPSNPHQIYAVARGGNITRTFKTSNPKYDATLSLRNVRMLTPDLLQFEETGRASELTVTMIKIDGKFRNWHSTQADGTVLIADGKFSDSGKPTVAFKSCGS